MTVKKPLLILGPGFAGNSKIQHAQDIANARQSQTVKTPGPSVFVNTGGGASTPIGLATETAPGLMSAADKTKLDNLVVGGGEIEEEFVVSGGATAFTLANGTPQIDAWGFPRIKVFYAGQLLSRSQCTASGQTISLVGITPTNGNHVTIYYYPQ